MLHRVAPGKASREAAGGTQLAPRAGRSTGSATMPMPEQDRYIMQRMRG